MQDQDKIVKLEQQLRDAIAAERFFETESGRLFKELATEKVNALIKEITSDKYIKDHVGYTHAVAELNMYKNMLGRLQFTGMPARKAKIEERLEHASE